MPRKFPFQRRGEESGVSLTLPPLSLYTPLGGILVYSSRWILETKPRGLVGLCVLRSCHEVFVQITCCGGFFWARTP